MNLRIQYALAAALAVSLPMGARALLNADDAPAALERLERSYLDRATASGVQDLDNWHRAHVASLKTMARIPDLARMDPGLAKRELQNFLRPLPSARLAYLTDASGQQFLRTDEIPLGSVGDRPYHAAALATGLGRSVVFGRTTLVPAFVMAAPLAPQTGGSGVVAIALELTRISSVVLGAGSDKEKTLDSELALPGEQRFIALDDGKLLAHSLPSAVAEPKPGALADASAHPLWKARPVSGQITQRSYSDTAGKRWVGAIRQSETGWHVAVEVPESEFLAEASSRSSNPWPPILMASLLAALAAFFASSLAARRPGRASAACALAGSALLPLAALVAFERSAALEAAASSAREQVAIATATSARHMSGWLAANLASIEPLAATPDLDRRAFSGAPADGEWAVGRLRLAISELPWVQYAFLSDKGGRIALRTNDGPHSQMGDRKYFKQARVESWGSQFVISRSSGRPILNLAKSIKSSDGSFMGIAAYSVQTDALLEQLARAPVGKTGFRFVLDNQGGLLAHPAKGEVYFKGDEPRSYSDHPLWAKRPAAATLSSAVFERGRAAFVGSIARSGPFYVASVVPMAEAREPADKAFANHLLWAALSLALAAALGAAFASNPRSTTST